MRGITLKRLRELKGFTQEQLAKLLDVSRQTIGHYEADRAKPDLETLNKFAEVFDVTTDHLLGRDIVDPTDGHLHQSILKSATPTTRTLIPVPVYDMIYDKIPVVSKKHIWITEAESGGNGSFFLKVHQDNLTAMGIKAGCLVLVHRQNTLENGDIGLIIIESNQPATITRFWQPDSGVVVLSAEDIESGPLVKKLAGIQIIGKVVEYRVRL